MPLKDKKQDTNKTPMFSGLLGEKLKKTTPEWGSRNEQKKLPESVRRGKSTKAFNRKKAGR
ncbi:MAG: hypothetical protein WCQ53_06505 [bacterium]